MKFALLATIATLLISPIAAWTAEDHEIFQLRDDVIASEGANTTFYSFVGVQRKASIDDINKAYRRRAAALHPDKARAKFTKQWEKDHKPTAAGKKIKAPEKEVKEYVKKNNDRYARLGVVAEILRGASRDRYDFFLDHGFPKWRGTGYYYQRYRPGAGTVLIGLFVVGGGVAHYAALVLGWKQQRQFAEKYIRDARKMAWGKESVVPGLDTIGQPVTNGTTDGDANGNGAPSTMGMNRKQKRAQEKENKKSAKKGVTPGESITPEAISEPIEATLISGPQGTKRRVVAENGKTLIVDSVGNVFLEETTEEGETHEFLIDVS